MSKAPKTVVSPLAPARFPDMLPVSGLRLATGHAGIKASSTKLDLMLAVFDRPASVAGVFTKSSTAGAPVRWCRKHLPKGKARAR